MIGRNPRSVTNTVLKLLRDTPNQCSFLVHRPQDYGQCMVSLLGYRGMCNVIDHSNVRTGTIGTSLIAKIRLR